MAFEFNDANFQTEAIESDQLVMVDFWAEWCGPCKRISPIIDELADEFDGKVKVGKVNVDNNSDVPTQFKVRSIPLVVLMKNGEVVEKMVGARSKADYLAAIEKHA